MSNKFKIRNLENEKRRIEKLIDKLKREDVKEQKLFTVLEERESKIHKVVVSNTFTQKFKYEYTRKGNEIKCKVICIGSSKEGVGVAKCHNEDDFNQHIGCAIAERRAVADYYNKLAEEEGRRYY